MNKDLMSEEAFNELIDGLEYVERLTEYGRRNIKYYVQKLQKENKLLIERIDDSIDYLNNNICYVGKKITIKPYTDLKDLLEILKGDNNE